MPTQPASAARQRRSRRSNKPWERFISAAGQLSPIGDFFGRDFDEWAASLSLNSVAQMRLLHALYPLRETRASAKVAFLVGGGINGPFRNYSAYCLGKVMLVKLCELLDDEYAGRARDRGRHRLGQHQDPSPDRRGG